MLDPRGLGWSSNHVHSGSCLQAAEKKAAEQAKAAEKKKEEDHRRPMLN